MVIGNFSNLRHAHGNAAQLNKWYWGIEIRACHPGRTGIWKPYFFCCFVKWIDFGEPYIYLGKKEIKKGGWWWWECPVGIEKIRIIH